MYSLLEIERKYGYNKRKNILEKRGRYLKKKECAYCKKEFDSNRKRSAEHIFPQVLLELFPEQDVSFTPERTFKDNFGLTIADVCSECNNGILSGLDQYGGKLIKEQFLEEIDYNLKDSEIEKEIDYSIFVKWIIKITYNYMRSRKMDCSFITKYIECILEDKEMPDAFNVFMGVHVNTTPLPERCYEYKPLEIVEEPRLIGTALGLSMLHDLPLDYNRVIISGSEATLCLRFGNAIIYIVFWKNSSIKEMRTKYVDLLQKEFNFKMLKPGKNKYKLKRVTASSNISMGYWHLLSRSALRQDDMLVNSLIHGRDVKAVRKSFESMRSEEDWRASQLLVERDMFPENRRVKKEYEDFFRNRD